MKRAHVRTAQLLSGAAALCGVIAWIVYLRADLVLSHYDAKAHLVVARRIIDNLTPGWQQAGAVWLPLPHLLQLLPVQVDLFYRTGAAGSLTSIACFALTAYAFARIVLLATDSRSAAAAAVGVLALNPNLLYLQATPMTEPLLLAATSLAVLWLFEWVQRDEDRVPPQLAVALFATTWTRYEAWPILAAAIGAALFASWRGGAAWGAVVRRAIGLATWPAVAVAAFLVNSRITVGHWFVSDGFFVPDPQLEHQPVATASAVLWGLRQLSGVTVEGVALITAVAVLAFGLAARRQATILLALAPLAAAALPLYAFYEGHPYRIRYMVPLVAACALLVGIGVGRLRRFAPYGAAAIVAAAVVAAPPWDTSAAMVLEAQWDRPASLARRAVTECLTRGYHGEKVLASMGSLAHYMQELSRSGFAIADFVHEGNGVIWEQALETGPAPHVGWMLVEEFAEGGDVLAARLRRDPSFAAGMTRTCEGGGVALYRRDTAPALDTAGDEAGRSGLPIVRTARPR